MAVEVDPDERAGDATLVARVRASVGAAQGVHRCLFASHGVVDGLQLSENVLADLGLWFCTQLRTYSSCC